MPAIKQQVVQADDGQWKIIETNAKGEESTKDTVAEVEAMGDGEALQVYQGLVSQGLNKRRAALSLGVGIILLSYSKLEDYKGSGDRETGQLSNALKDQFRKAEDAYFDQFMEDKHPLHKSFTNRLPKMNERGESLDAENPKLTMQERYAYFIKSLRSDPSYAAAKNLLLNYWAFVGQEAWHEANDERYILPPEVMRVRINAAKDVKPRDNSWETQIVELCRKLYMPDDPKKPIILRSEKIGEVKDALQLAMQEVERQERIMAQGQAHKVKPGDVVTQTQEAMQNAQGKREATPPGEGAVVSKEYVQQ